MWGKVQAQAFSIICKALNESNVKWLVMRNYEGLPESNRSKDLDLGVSHNDFNRVNSIIQNSLKNIGFVKVFRLRYQYAICSTYFYEREETLESIKIDIIDGFVWRGAQIVSFDEVYNNRQKYDSFCVPSIEDDAFMLLVKPLMTGGFIKEKYIPDIEKAIDCYGEIIREKWLNTFPGELGNQTWNYVKRHDYEELCGQKAALCKVAWRRKIKQYPLETVSKFVEHAFLESKRVLIRKRPTMVAVVGPDGVGKSTFIDTYINQLADLVVSDPQDIKLYHFRPNVFPNIKKVISGKKYDESKEEFTNPHRGGKTNPISSLLRMTYYWGDYVIGYYLKIKLSCRHNGKVIFDRYISDYLVDPERSRVYLPYIVRALFVKFTPQPDLTYVLSCDANVVYQRKQELSVEEIQKILDRYERVARNHKKYVKLDATKTPEQMSNEACLQYIMRTEDI